MTTTQNAGAVTPASGEAPQKHNLDKRAHKLLVAEESQGDADEMISTRQLAAWLDVSQEWAEIGRHRGYGPPFVVVGPRMVRYRRGDVRRWLAERTHASTAEYETVERNRLKQSPGRPRLAKEVTS